MEDTVFGKIIRRELPADIVYEDEDTLAFLDIMPVAKGHTLVIPKKAYRNIFDIDESTFEAVMRTVRRLAPALSAATGANGINIITNNEAAAGQEVFHAHVHLIPRFTGDGLMRWPKTTYAEGEKAQVAQMIRAALS